MDDVLKNLKKETAALRLQGACQLAHSDLAYYAGWFCEFPLRILVQRALRDAAHSRNEMVIFPQCTVFCRSSVADADRFPFGGRFGLGLWPELV